MLFAELPVEEHRLFFGRMKGYRNAEFEEVVENQIQEAGLTEKDVSYLANCRVG